MQSINHVGPVQYSPSHVYRVEMTGSPDHLHAADCRSASTIGQMEEHRSRGPHGGRYYGRYPRQSTARDTVQQEVRSGPSALPPLTCVAGCIYRKHTERRACLA